MYIRPFISSLKNVRLPTDPVLKLTVAGGDAGQDGLLIPQLRLTFATPLIFPSAHGSQPSTLPPVEGYIEVVAPLPYAPGSAPKDWMDVPFYLAVKAIDAPPGLPWKYSAGDVLAAVDAAAMFVRNAFARWVKDEIYAICTDPVTGKDTTLSYNDWYYIFRVTVIGGVAREHEKSLEATLGTLRELWERHQAAALVAVDAWKQTSKGWFSSVSNTRPIRPESSKPPEPVVLVLPCGVVVTCGLAIPLQAVNPDEGARFVITTASTDGTNFAHLNPHWVKQSMVDNPYLWASLSAPPQVAVSGSFELKRQGSALPYEFKIYSSGTFDVWLGSAPAAPATKDFVQLTHDAQAFQSELREELWRQAGQAIYEWVHYDPTLLKAEYACRLGADALSMSPLPDFQDWYREHLLVHEYRAARRAEIEIWNQLEELMGRADLLAQHDLLIQLHNEAEEFDHPPEEPED